MEVMGEPDDSKNTKQKLIETIKKNSKDFASILNLNDDHSNNTAGMTSGQQQEDDSTAEEQVRLAFEKWIEKSKLDINVTSKTLIEVLSKSKPYDMHATNLGDKYEKLLSNISGGMECDWELFAITDLNLKESEVYEIITLENTVEAQIRSALDLWSNKNECKQYETLLDIVLNSSVYKDTEHNSCWRKLSGDQGVNTGSADVDDQHIKDTSCKRSQNPDGVFNEMIQSVAVMIGNTGAFHLLQNYTDACDQKEVKENDQHFQEKEFDGGILTKYLIESGRLFDNTESLETFRIRLTESNLYLARNKIDEYMSQQQNKENNDDGFMDQNSSVPKDENVQ
ncbi:hypothetical protein BSL78_02206 [Apostichopus japonicus]|uniref:Death domain-containing protein n=1 Tax=Stichopus japonicus TaxID=307972 RepID=A0A2G8LL52_STIJA|nr:hypothetical protein BSL78_02206 [Apostichopus japonicus]